MNNLCARQNTLESGRYPSSPRGNSRCAVMVPVAERIEPACEKGLRELERRGYHVRRGVGFAAIDEGRSQMATMALAAGYEETMWINSDIEFHAEDVDRLRSHRLPIVCGLYPKKGRREVACHLMPDTQQIVFGEEGGLLEIVYAATGFLLVRREAYAEIQQQLHLPWCNERWGNPMIPFFQPMVRPDGEGSWYLAEDYAFCERARQCGHKIMADTTIRLKHHGNYGYGWEDAGIDRPRHTTFRFNVSGAEAAAVEDPAGSAVSC